MFRNAILYILDDCVWCMSARDKQKWFGSGSFCTLLGRDAHSDGEHNGAVRESVTPLWGNEGRVVWAKMRESRRNGTCDCLK